MSLGDLCVYCVHWRVSILLPLLKSLYRRLSYAYDSISFYYLTYRGIAIIDRYYSLLHYSYTICIISPSIYIFPSSL